MRWYRFPSGIRKFWISEKSSLRQEYTLHYETGGEYDYPLHKLRNIIEVDPPEGYNTTLDTLSVNELYTDIREIIEGENNMDTLYEVNGKFAKKLAVNSAGMWVLEEKGTGTVFTADKKDCEEVVPYTVDIKFQGNGSSYSYTSKEGKFSVGDLLWMPDNGYGENFARVVAVGTKSKKATKELAPIGRFVLDTDLKD